MKVAVLGAGGPAGVNTCRALQKAGHYVYALDANEQHLAWVAPVSNRQIHMPDPNLDQIRELGADVVLPQPDPLVLWLSQHQDSVTTLLPQEGVIWTCQDKARAVRVWHKAGLREFEPYELEEPWADHLHLASDRLGCPFWLRARRGAGAKGAILVRDLRSAYHWIRFWDTREAGIDWVAEEYLPGRDIAWTSIWYDGTLVTSFARERTEYLYPHLTPEGLTGTPTIATVIHDDRVNEIATDAVQAVDEAAHGIYSVDIREDAFGRPRPTEINAGRGFTTLGLWSLYGVNFLDIAVRLAADGKNWWLRRPDLTEPSMFDALPEGLTLSRHIDCGHTFSRALVAA